MIGFLIKVDDPLPTGWLRSHFFILVFVRLVIRMYVVAYLLHYISIEISIESIHHVIESQDSARESRVLLHSSRELD